MCSTECKIIMGRFITYIKMTIWILKTGNFQCSMARVTTVTRFITPISVFKLGRAKKRGCWLHQFSLETNSRHSTIKFMAKISDKKINFLHTTIFKGEWFHKDWLEQFNTHISLRTMIQTCTRKGFNSGTHRRLQRTNSSKTPLIWMSEATQIVWLIESS